MAPAADEMMNHIRSTVDPKTVERSKCLGELASLHIVTATDDKIASELEMMLAQIQSGSAVEGYALTISGKSGAGKTTILNTRIDNHPSFASFQGQYNELSLSLRATTPASCTAKTLGKELLRATGYRLEGNRDEDYIWDMLIERMKKRQTRILVLDEFQHVLNAPTSKGYLHLSDTIKNLMQTKGWPIWLILSGVPEIESFIDRDPNGQLDRRAPLIKVEEIGDTHDDIDNLSDILNVLLASCNLKLGFKANDEFFRRLRHGGIRRLGLTIQIIKNAIQLCIFDDSAWDPVKGGFISLRHFEEGYTRLARNCPSESNVFLAKEWHLIQREVDGSGFLVGGDVNSSKRRGRR